MNRTNLMVLAIHATQSQADRKTADGWVGFALNAAEEARHEVLNNPPMEEEPTGGFAAIKRELDKQQGKAKPLERLAGLELVQAAEQAARVAYLAAMPRLTSRSNAQASIACVAVGVQQGYITGPEARTMLYTAQLALGAFPKRNSRKAK